MKYEVEFVSGGSGYGSEFETNDLKEVERLVDKYRYDYEAKVVIWDNGIDKFIYYKNFCRFKPDIDMLREFGRDFRTTTRKRKAKG